MQGLKQKRKNRGLTQKALAEFLGVQQSTVSMWESGEAEPRKDTRDKLCELFDCKIDDLM